VTPVEQGERLLTIVDGWDGPGSKAPSKQAVLCGVLLLSMLIEAGYSTPLLYPTHGGGMQAEWPCGPQTHNVSLTISESSIYLHALDLLTDDAEYFEVEWPQFQRVIDALKRTLVRPTT